jgi:hypothetical protein
MTPATVGAEGWAGADQGAGGEAGAAGELAGAPPVSPRKNALARRSIAPTSGTNAPATKGSASNGDAGAPVGSGVGMGIFWIAADLDVVEHSEHILRQHGQRAVEGD